MRQKKILGFVIPSVIGILLFMIPIQYHGEWTIVVKIISDIIVCPLAHLIF